MTTMAKDKRGQLANERRYGPVTAKELRDGADELRRIAIGLETTAEAMDAAKVKSIETDAVTRLPRGTELVDSFLKHVRKAMIEAGH